MSFLSKLVRAMTGQPERRYSVKRNGPGWKEAPTYQPSEAGLARAKASSSTIDLRSQDGPIFDQGKLGSCTANGWSGLLMFICKKQFGETFIGSRLMLYFEERALNGEINSDAGAEVSDGAKVLSTTGVCAETDWPYDVSKFKQKPSAQCYTAAAQHKLVDPMQVTQDLNHLKACLSEGFPFVFGFDVYSSFESLSTSRTGIIPMPQPHEKLLGGHEMEAVGYIDADGNATFVNETERARYNNKSQLAVSINHFLRILTGSKAFDITPPTNCFIVRNSWGTSWGDDGYGYMPYDYLTTRRLSSDFWTARHATDGAKAA